MLGVLLFLLFIILRRLSSLFVGWWLCIGECLLWMF